MAEKKKERDLLEKFDGMFRSALNKPSWIDWRENAVDDFKFFEGNQWTDKELSELRDRGQPDTIENQTAAFVKWLKGLYEERRTRIAYRGRNVPDQAQADTLTACALFVQQNNSFTDEEDLMLDDGFQGGFGVLWCDVDMSNPVDPMIRIKHENCFDVYPDPYSTRYDWNEDARFIIKAKWMELEEAKSLWPDKKKELDLLVAERTSTEEWSGVDELTDNVYFDQDYERVRPVEVWWKEKEDAVLISYPNGMSETRWLKDKSFDDEERSFITANGGRVYPVMRDRVYVASYISGTMLEGKKSPWDHDRFPGVPYFYARKKSGEPYGMVRELKPMQKELNKRRSKALHLLIENQLVIAEGAIIDEDELALQKSRPDGILKWRYRDGYPAPELIKNTELGAAQMGLHDSASIAMRQISGINPDAMGERSEVRSGIGIHRKQMMAQRVVSTAIKNINKTHRVLGRTILEHIREFYSHGKIFSITDDLKATKQYMLQPLTDKTIKYDIITEEAPDFATMQEEQFYTIAELLPQILPLGIPAAIIMLQMSNLRNKEELIAQLQQAYQPPPDQPKLNVSMNWEEMTPQEKAMIAVNARWIDLDQAARTFNVDPKSIMKAKADLQKTAMKIEGDSDKAALDAAVRVEEIQGKIHEAKMKSQEKKVAKGN